jgi:MFS transporter, putative metabolite:H+ symporter
LPEPEPESADRARGAQILARLDTLAIWPYPRMVLWVIGIGFFFAFYDVVNLGFALPVIEDQFGVSQQAGSLAVTGGLAGYVVGAYAVARFADVHGRKHALYVSVGLYCAGSVLAAVSGSLTELVVARFIAGLGIGAEIAAVTTYLSELSPAHLRGRITSLATVAAFSGMAVVPLVASLIVPALDAGWRILFVAGAVGGVVTIAGRRHLPRSPRWLISQGRVDEAEAIVAGAERFAAAHGAPAAAPQPETAPAPASRGWSVGALDSAEWQRAALLTAIWFFYYLGNYGWLTLAPTLLVDRGYTIEQSLTYLISSGFGYVVGAWISTRVTERLERKFLLIGVLGVWVAALLAIGLWPSPVMVVAGGFVAATTIGIVIPVMYTVTAEHFRTQVRATGVALSDGLGHFGGAVAPLVVLGVTGGAFAGAFAVMAASGVVAAVLLPYTIRATGHRLEAVGA